VEQWNKRRSNFNSERVSRFVLSAHPYRPLHGSTFVPTPEFLVKKHCLVNVQNNDEKCFVWSVFSALYPPTHNPHRLSNYIDYEHSLNVEGLNFPIQTKTNTPFRKTQPHHIRQRFGLRRETSEPKYRTPPKVYSRPDPMTEFYDHVLEERKVISKIVSHQVPMRPMRSDEHKLHEAAT